MSEPSCGDTEHVVSSEEAGADTNMVSIPWVSAGPRHEKSYYDKQMQNTKLKYWLYSGGAQFPVDVTRMQ